MVELSGLFLRHGLAVTIVVVEPPAASTDASTAVARAAEANPSVNFHVLPLPPPDTTVPPAAAEQGQGQEPPRDPFALLRRANAPLRDYLRSVLASASVRALVLDMFCVDALDVATELGVPAYIFYTSSASSLAVSLHMPHKQAEVNASFGDIGDAPLFFPGVPPFRPTELRHRATGAFVTHCGWNSVLEGITAGVPLLCWPLYAEQRLNKVFMVEETRVGVEMAGYDREVVTAQEVEAKVRWVMDSEDGRALRPRAMVA